jgi:hypothetical protein
MKSTRFVRVQERNFGIFRLRGVKAIIQGMRFGTTRLTSKEKESLAIIEAYLNDMFEEWGENTKVLSEILMKREMPNDKEVQKAADLQEKIAGF